MVTTKSWVPSLDYGYVIIEDCHKNPEQIDSLLERIQEDGEGNLRFLFTLRKCGKLLLKDVDDALCDLGEEKTTKNSKRG